MTSKTELSGLCQSSTFIIYIPWKLFSSEILPYIFFLLGFLWLHKYFAAYHRLLFSSYHFEIWISIVLLLLLIAFVSFVISTQSSHLGRESTEELSLSDWSVGMFVGNYFGIHYGQLHPWTGGRSCIRKETEHSAWTNQEAPFFGGLCFSSSLRVLPYLFLWCTT